MAWLDIYGWPDGGGLLVDCQADLLSFLPSRFVVPFVPDYPGRVIRRLNPTISFAGHRYTLVPQLATTVMVSELDRPLGSLVAHEYDVLRAIDFLLTGI